jgi:hypothetical protein
MPSGRAFEAKLDLAAAFWNEMAKHIADWGLAKERKVSAADLRRDYIHAHTLALAALARAGCDLIRKHPRDWKQKLARLKSLDWSRGNARLWEGRAMNAAAMARHESRRVRERLSPNAGLPNSLVYTPIEDWTNDDVWLYLMQVKNAGARTTNRSWGCIRALPRAASVRWSSIPRRRAAARAGSAAGCARSWTRTAR